MTREEAKHSGIRQFGEVLRGWRNRKSKSQKKMAHSLGVSQSSISDWERGINEPSREQLVRVLHYLEVDEGLWAILMKAPGGKNRTKR
jgi:transcriptional regulator with XRE-family HTH domain